MATPLTTPTEQSDSPLSVGYYQAENYQPHESVGYLMKTVSGSIAKMIDAAMQKYDLTDAQWRPLLYLHYGKANTAAAMAKEACLDTGAMTRMLDRLEKKGLVERTRCGQDRRVIFLALTPAGKRLCEIIPTDLCKAMNHHLQGFSAHDVETLKALLTRMLSNGQTD